MRVLISTPLFPPDIGGPATYSKVLAEEFPKYGVNVEVLSFGGVRHLPKIIRHAVYFCQVFWRARKADIIFAQDPVSVGFPSALASMILRKPFILKVVGDYAWEQGVNRFGVKELLDEFLNTPHGWRIEFLRRVERFVANRARAVIVPSRYLKSVVEKWGIESEKIKVIYNSVQLRYIEVEKEKVRKELDLAGKILVSVGRLVPWKGFEMLIEIMPEISKKYSDTKLLIIGSGPEESALKAKSYQLKANVQFLGNLPHEQVLKYLRAADIFLLNTGYEGFSHQILEAMAVGAPIISTSAGGNKEILQDSQNALLADYNNEKAWFEAISELLDKLELAKNLAEKARLDVSKFAGQNMFKETLKILKEAV